MRALPKPWRMRITEPLKQKNGDPSPAVLILGFAVLIGIGALLLILPISSQTGEITPPGDAFFSAASAVCVTGLVVRDTGTYWSLFGQAVILILIQLGGLGFMTSATLLVIALGRHIGLREKLLVGESLGIRRLGGLTNLIRNIAIFTFASELIGTLMFYFYFSSHTIDGMPIWESIFQAVSSFNNAGFDLFGSFSSLADYPHDTFLLLTTAVLAILGGISYVVVADVFARKRFSYFALDTKIVLTSTATLLLLGMAVILFTEFSNPATLGGLAVSDKLVVSFFQSVTARTSGFTAISMSSVTHYCLFFIIVLMFIGGASGSTAGGIKVNTFGILIATLISSLRGQEFAGAFEREFVTQQIYRALAVVILSLAIITMVVFVLTITEKYDFLDLFFEAVSAFANVGLSTGVTSGLSLTGKLTITFTMFIGRLGPLAIALALIERQRPSTFRYPQEAVRIG